jgi:dihydroneopterin aldolase
VDTLIINNLSIHATIGVHEWEQKIKQQLLLNITIPYDFSMCDDSLENVIDYDGLCQRVTTFIQSGVFKLIETVANQVAQLILQEYSVQEVMVEVTKPHAVANAGIIKVSVTRKSIE